MAAALLPARGLALRGAPDSDMTSRDPRTTNIQAMHIDMTQDMVDRLLDSLRTGKPPHISFGRTPQLRYADQTHPLQTSSESSRYELYHASGAGSDDALDFTSLINHSLIVQQAQVVTAGVDTALEQLKNSMAAISELKQANKTIVGTAGTPTHTPGHRRVPSKGFVPAHLAPSAAGSPLLHAPLSPAAKPSAPTSQPSGARDVILDALRVPLIHLLAIQPSKEPHLAETCRTSLANVRELLPKIAKRSSDDAEKWQLTDKSFREFNPYKFPYRSASDREQAVNNAIKSFDRLRLTKDDKLWQILLPREERGQGKCLSRLNVKVPEPKAAKPSTPLHKITKLNDKKPAMKKVDDKKKEAKDAEPKPKKVVREKMVKPTKSVKESTVNGSVTASSTPKVTATATTPSYRNTSTDTGKVRTKKAAPVDSNSSPRVKPKMSSRDLPRDRYQRPQKPAVLVNTKPKNPSPLSASPPVNASDFEDAHPVHKALSAAPSPAKTPGHSDRSLKRKANDVDSDIHNHSLAVKKPHVERATPSRTPGSTNGRLNGNTPSSTSSLKRKSDVSSTSSTPSSKIRKVTSIDTSLASRYPHHSQTSPGASSSSTTSPSVPSLSFRQTVELSQKFQKYYKKYEDLYWQLTESASAPTEAQRNDLLKMHKKLEEMKREIKSGAGMHR